MTARLGADVVIAATATDGVELSLGVVRDPLLGPLLVVGAGGLLVELLRDRAVMVPPLDPAGARRMLGRLGIAPLLEGWRGSAAVDLEAVVAAIVALSTLAVELGSVIAGLDINPLRCSPGGATALDVLVEEVAPGDD